MSRAQMKLLFCHGPMCNSYWLWAQLYLLWAMGPHGTIMGEAWWWSQWKGHQPYTLSLSHHCDHLLKQDLCYDLWFITVLSSSILLIIIFYVTYYHLLCYLFYIIFIRALLYFSFLYPLWLKKIISYYFFYQVI